MTQFAYDKPKHRARIALLSHIAQFDLRTIYGGQVSRGLSSGGFRHADDCRVGDLVSLKSAPPSKWYLSWVHEVKVEQYGDIYVLESIEDGELCNWSNVSVIVYDRKEVDLFPKWRWSDKQFEFNDRWNKVTYKDRDAYITLPVPPVFGEGTEVTLGTRTRFGFDDHKPTKTFPDWRKLTKAQMVAFYDECVASRPLPAHKEQAE